MQKSEKKRGFPLLGSLLSLILAILCLYLFTVGAYGVAERAGEEKLRTLQEAVRRASVQCYAIEGRYPPSVEYLEAHYGISIDRKAYAVFYDGWASNVMPEITIIALQGGERR